MSSELVPNVSAHTNGDAPITEKNDESEDKQVAVEAMAVDGEGSTEVAEALSAAAPDATPTANGKKEAGASEQGATIGVALRGGQIRKAPGPRGHLDGAGADEDGEGENHEHGEREQALHGAAEALFRGFHAAPGPELCASHSVTGWVLNTVLDEVGKVDFV